MTVRLFQLYDTKERKFIDTYFSSKPAAKQQRVSLNTKDNEGKEILRYVVKPGPDHHRYKEI